MQDFEWPCTKNNAQKQDNGCLLLDIPKPSFPADFNDRVKPAGKAVYRLAALSKKNLLSVRKLQQGSKSTGAQCPDKSDT